MKYAEHDDEPAPVPNAPHHVTVSLRSYENGERRREALAAYAVRLFRELERLQGGTQGRRIMAELVAEVPSVADALTAREREQIEKREGWA